VWSQWQVRVFRGAAKAYTTTPYPILVVDSLAPSSSAIEGTVWQPPLDEVAISSLALDGVHRALVKDYENYTPEEIDITSAAIDGVHRLIVQSYTDGLPEEIDVTSAALDGTHKIVRIDYPNYEPEEIDITSHALNGTHAPI
jgi:hypothetical protein